MEQHFWQGKRVLVTGADGFIGSHLSEKLVALGAEVTVHLRGTSVSGTVGYTLRNIAHLQERLASIVTGNIASPESVRLIKDARPQVIFHLAADAYVPNSFSHPREVMETNLIGTINVLHATMELSDLEQAVFTSSSEIYGSAQYLPMDEQHPLNPTSPYAASKAAADRFCYAYWSTYGLPISIIRPFNTYGPRHTYDVIPKFISLALHGQPLTIHGDGEQSRDFTYVTDMVNAFLALGCHKEVHGQVVNFGSGEAVTINRIAQLIVQLSGSSAPIVHIEDRTSQVRCLCCDYSKASRLLGWSPQVSLEEGLRMNIQWEISRLSG